MSYSVLTMRMIRVYVLFSYDRARNVAVKSPRKVTQIPWAHNEICLGVEQYLFRHRLTSKTKFRNLASIQSNSAYHHVSSLPSTQHLREGIHVMLCTFHSTHSTHNSSRTCTVRPPCTTQVKSSYTRCTHPKYVHRFSIAEIQNIKTTPPQLQLQLFIQQDLTTNHSHNHSNEPYKMSSVTNPSKNNQATFGNAIKIEPVDSDSSIQAPLARASSPRRKSWLETMLSSPIPAALTPAPAQAPVHILVQAPQASPSPPPSPELPAKRKCRKCRLYSQ
jgi:hypothetical protein